MQVIFSSAFMNYKLTRDVVDTFLLNSIHIFNFNIQEKLDFYKGKNSDNQV